MCGSSIILSMKVRRKKKKNIINEKYEYIRACSMIPRVTPREMFLKREKKKKEEEKKIVTYQNEKVK